MIYLMVNNNFRKFEVAELKRAANLTIESLDTGEALGTMLI
jgi:hypothetical protein